MLTIFSTSLMFIYNSEVKRLNHQITQIEKPETIVKTQYVDKVEYIERFFYGSEQFDHPDFIKPLKVDYFISSQMAERGEIIIGETKSQELIHRGIDMVPIKKGGSRVYAVADGIIVSHWPACYGGHPIYGVSVIIKHDNGFYSCYSHLADTYLNIKEGNFIKQGDLIGVTGSTGFSTGEHLHFELVIDPMVYIES